MASFDYTTRSGCCSGGTLGKRVGGPQECCWSGSVTTRRHLVQNDDCRIDGIWTPDGGGAVCVTFLAACWETSVPFVHLYL